MRGRTMKNVPVGRASRKNEKGSLALVLMIYILVVHSGISLVQKSLETNLGGDFRLGPSRPNLMQDGRGSYKAGSSNTRKIPSRS